MFDKILTDIGDNQSIENHLSTYSYRLKKMNQFLRKCNENTLFLIDEFEEFYVYLHAFSLEIDYSADISERIQNKIDRYGLIKDDASLELSAIRKRLNVVKGKINSSFTKILNRCIQSDYLDEIRESVVDNRRVLAVKAMHRRKVNGSILGTSKTGSIVYIEPQEALDYANELSGLIYEEQEEVKRIIKELTDLIRPFRHLLHSYQEYLTTMDVIRRVMIVTIDLIGRGSHWRSFLIVAGVGLTFVTVTCGSDDPEPSARDGSPQFQSATFSKDGTYTHTFDTAGTFAYFCEVHPSMVGSITVK